MSRLGPCLLLAALGCGSDPAGAAGTGGSAGAPPAAIMDDCTVAPGVYDEAWAALYDRKDAVQVDAAQASAFVTPKPGQVLDSTAGPVVLRWTELGPAPAAKPGVAPAPGVRPHGCSLDQDLYWMQLQIGAETVHVLNLDREWTMTAVVLGKTIAAGGQVTARLVRAPMVSDRVDAGPFRQAADVTFQVH